jgi:hypothetical protein
MNATDGVEVRDYSGALLEARAHLNAVEEAGRHGDFQAMEAPARAGALAMLEVAEWAAPAKRMHINRTGAKPTVDRSIELADESSSRFLAASGPSRADSYAISLPKLFHSVVRRCTASGPVAASTERVQAAAARGPGAPTDVDRARASKRVADRHWPRGLRERVPAPAPALRVSVIGLALMAAGIIFWLATHAP